MSLSDPIVTVLGKAVCIFSEADRRVLYATYLSRKGAFILSVSPPELKQEIAVIFELGGKAALPPIRARVVDIVADSRAMVRNGFAVEFFDLDAEAYGELSAAVSSIAQGPTPPPHRDPTAPIDRRKDARITLQQRTVVEYGSWVLQGELKNLSISGALIPLDWPGACASVRPGATLVVTFRPGAPTKPLRFMAEVARVFQGKGSCELGVRFVETSRSDAGLLDSFLLKTLVRQLQNEAAAAIGARAPGLERGGTSTRLGAPPLKPGLLVPRDRP